MTWPRWWPWHRRDRRASTLDIRSHAERIERNDARVAELDARVTRLRTENHLALDIVNALRPKGNT